MTKRDDGDVNPPTHNPKPLAHNQQRLPPINPSLYFLNQKITLDNTVLQKFSSRKSCHRSSSTVYRVAVSFFAECALYLCSKLANVHKPEFIGEISCIIVRGIQRSLQSQMINESCLIKQIKKTKLLR